MPTVYLSTSGSGSFPPPTVLLKEDATVAIDTNCCCGKNNCGIVVSYDQISSTHHKCGWGGWGCFNQNNPPCGPDPEHHCPCTTNDCPSGTVYTTQHFYLIPQNDPPDCFAWTCVSFSGGFSGAKFFLNMDAVYSCSPHCAPGDANGLHRSIDPYTCAETETGSSPTCGGWEETDTFSNEFTDEMLKSITEETLPAYDDDFDDDGTASRLQTTHPNGGLFSYSLARFRPKFTIPEAQDGDVVVCYVERFQETTDNGAPIGDPVDEDKNVTIGAGETEVIGDEVAVDEGIIGIKTLVNITCDCTCWLKVKGYTKVTMTVTYSIQFTAGTSPNPCVPNGNMSGSWDWDFDPDNPASFPCSDGFQQCRQGGIDMGVCGPDELLDSDGSGVAGPAPCNPCWRNHVFGEWYIDTQQGLFFRGSANMSASVAPSPPADCSWDNGIEEGSWQGPITGSDTFTKTHHTDYPNNENGLAFSLHEILTITMQLS